MTSSGEGRWARFARRVTGRAEPAGPLQHEAEVWRVRDMGEDGLDYYVARCACEWLSDSVDSSAPDAEARTFAVARGHTPSVAPTVVHPLG